MPADQTTSPADIPLMTVIRRGLSRRCPNCGKGAVLSGYLTRVPVCGSCGEDLSHISADDGPAWATLIVVGHVLAPFLIILGRDERIPVWVAIGALAAMMPLHMPRLIPIGVEARVSHGLRVTNHKLRVAGVEAGKCTLLLHARRRRRRSLRGAPRYL